MKLYLRKNSNFENVKKVMSYLEEMEIPLKDVGIPTSFRDSGQQWDGRYNIKHLHMKCLYFIRFIFQNLNTKYAAYIFSNAWPPLQEMVVTGLEKSGYEPAQELALNIVKKWVKNGFLAYKDTIEETGSAIYFEKYDIEKVFLVLKLAILYK